VFLLERYATGKIRRSSKGGHKYKDRLINTAIAILGITSLESVQVTPEHLGTYVGVHWAIENKVH
jgi:hypothetical protein